MMVSAFELSAPKHWCKATIADTGEYINGVAFKDSDWQETGLPIIRIQNLTDQAKPFNRTTREVREGSRISDGDILVSWSATLDAFRWDRGPAVLNQHIFKVVPNHDRVDDRFLFYLLKESIAEMRQSAHVHGSTMKHINRGPFLAHEVFLPPLDEQRQIVAEIETQFARLDDAVVSLKRAQVRLKRYRASVLKAACEGRLVLTEAELARQEGRDYEPASVLLERIKTERESSFKVYGGGKYSAPQDPATEHWDYELPDSWELSSLEQVTSASRTIRYGILKPKSNVVDGVLYAEVKDIKQDRVDVTRLHKTTFEMAAQYGKATLRTGDLLLAIRGSYGRVATTPTVLDGGNISRDIARIDVSRLISSDFVAIFLRNPDAQNYYKRVAKGVAVKGVNISDVRATPIALPPFAEQLRIVDEVDRVTSVIDQMEAIVEANLKRAESLRQSILGLAFSGRLMSQNSGEGSG